MNTRMLSIDDPRRSITYTVDIPMDMGPFHYFAAAARILVAEREAELERFAISGAMPRDLCVVVSQFIAITPGASLGLAVQQPWRVN